MTVRYCSTITTATNICYGIKRIVSLHCVSTFRTSKLDILNLYKSCPRGVLYNQCCTGKLYRSMLMHAGHAYAHAQSLRGEFAGICCTMQI